jgi:hypothetical protein
VANGQSSKYGTVADHLVLAAQLDMEANGGRTSDQIAAGIEDTLRWSCPVAPDHRWAASGGSRVRLGSGCPFCAGQRASVSNSLARYPELAAQFDVEANGGLTPDRVVAGTGKRLWWKCAMGPDHRWAASGSDRTKPGGTGCPFCAGQRVSVSNSLARYPELAAQFDVEANGGLNRPGSGGGSDLARRLRPCQHSASTTRRPEPCRTDV